VLARAMTLASFCSGKVSFEFHTLAWYFVPKALALAAYKPPKAIQEKNMI
jgi:hypothetical protein